MSITRLLIQTLDVILLKFEKLWTVIIPKIMIFYQWIKDGWKRATLLFKTLFLPSRYDSWLPRYHRAKGKVIFHRSLPTRRSFGSHWPSRLSQTRDERQSRLLEKRNNTILGTRFRERMKVILLAVHYALRKLWSRYRHESKTDSNGAFFSVYPTSGFWRRDFFPTLWTIEIPNSL